MLEAIPNVANNADHNGVMPLHKAINLKCSSAIILAILNANRDAAKTPDKDEKQNGRVLLVSRYHHRH